MVDNVTRRAALGGMAGAAMAPHAATAQLARDQAADMVEVQRIFVDLPLADAEAATTHHQLFKLVDSALGTATVYRRTASGSEELYQENTAAVLASTDPGRGAALVGLSPGGRVSDAIKHLTPAMFGIADDGDENQDVTAQLLALAAAATTLNAPIQLASREYRVNGTQIQFATSVRGGSGTVIRSTATTALSHLVRLIGNDTTFEHVEIDCNASADPASWNSGNYDSFTGNRGLRVTAKGVSITNVRVRNACWAGFLADPGSERISFTNCHAERCRGDFGDGFIAMGARQISYLNCTAQDFTRIGFVADAYGSNHGEHCAQISYINCYAENGHNSSIRYGGTQYNAGFWQEKTGNVTWDNCHARDTGQRGFVGTAGEAVLGINNVHYHGRNCTVEGVEVGFVLEGLASYGMRGLLENCYVKTDGREAFFVSTRSYDRVRLVECGSELSGSDTNRVSVRVGLGETIIDSFTERWAAVDTTKRDATDNYYGSLSHFNNAPGKIIVRDWTTVDADDIPIGSVFKFLSPASSTLDLTLERCFVRGTSIYANSLTASDVIFEYAGIIDIRQQGVFRGGAIRDNGDIYFRNETKAINLTDVLLDFVASGGALGFYNRNSSDPCPKIALRGCCLQKDFASATPSYGIRMNGDASVLGTRDANHIVFSDGVILNTGGATSNPVFQLNSPTDDASKVHGRGNLKSSSLSAVVNGSKLADAASFEDWG